MKILFIGDLHIEEKAIQELDSIIREIRHFKADMVIQLGDFYQSNRPTPAELQFGTEVAKKLKSQFGRCLILSGTGTHDMLRGTSIVTYLYQLGIEVVGQEHELEVDGKKILSGHFMTNESLLEYGTHKHTVTELEEKYDLTILGHQHQFQKISDKVIHLGSVRYQHFNELQDKNKKIALLEDGKLTFIALSTPYFMTEVKGENKTISDIIKELDSIDPDTKVRLVLTDYTVFKDLSSHLVRYKDKFVDFKIKLDSANYSPVQCSNETKSNSLSLFLKEYIGEIKDEEVRQILLEEFKQVL